MEPERFSIQLFGRFRVEGSLCGEAVFKSAKSQALLALIALDPHLRRSRAWLRERLWSDRGKEQGAASLRQCLFDIRNVLGAAGDFLVADRHSVGFDPSRVTVHRVGRLGDEFLDGLDVRDPVFCRWLEEQRRAGRTPIDAASPWKSKVLQPPIVSFRVEIRPEFALIRTNADHFVDIASRCLMEMTSVEVATALPAGHLADGIVVTLAMVGERDRFRVVAEEVSAGRHSRIWAAITEPLGRLADAESARQLVVLCNQLVEAIGDGMFRRLSRNPTYEASVIGRLAVRKIFSMRPSELQQADALLAEAHNHDPRGLFPAWRAQLRVIQWVERHDVDMLTLKEEAEAFAARALELEPGNSMVLATVSSQQLALGNNVLGGVEMARRSVQINPANPLAWDALSNASLFARDYATAHELACKAQSLGAGLPFRFWWDMGRCLSAALSGRFAEAIEHARLSSSLAPHFRPPVRYLVALNAAMGLEDEARAAAERLRLIEPSFSFDQMANDEKYPISMLRHAGGFKPDRIRALG